MQATLGASMLEREMRRFLRSDGLCPNRAQGLTDAGMSEVRPKKSSGFGRVVGAAIDGAMGCMNALFFAEENALSLRAPSAAYGSLTYLGKEER